MAADSLIHRAHVQARAAADAVQRLPQRRVFQQPAAPVVNDNQVELLRPILIVGPARPGNHAHVRRDALAGGRAGQQTQEHRQILQRRYHLLHTGQPHVNTGRRGAEPSVPFVGDDDQRAGFGHQKVRPADAHIGVQKLLTQYDPGHPRHLLDIVGVRHSQLFGEQLRHLSPRLVQRRRYQVRRRLFRQLDDVFAQVGLINVDALCLQHVVQAQLLGHHGLALGNGAHAGVARNLGHDGVGLLSVGGEVHLPAGRHHVLFQHRQVAVQVGDGVLFDATRLLAPAFPHLRRNFRNGLPPRAVKSAAGTAQRLPQLGILHRRLRCRHKLPCRHFRHSQPDSPSRICATCFTATGRFRRLTAPPMCIRQPMSQAATVSAPLASIDSILSANICSDM